MACVHYRPLFVQFYSKIRFLYEYHALWGLLRDMEYWDVVNGGLGSLVRYIWAFSGYLWRNVAISDMWWEWNKISQVRLDKLYAASAWILQHFNNRMIELLQKKCGISYGIVPLVYEHSGIGTCMWNGRSNPYHHMCKEWVLRLWG